MSVDYTGIPLSPIRQLLPLTSNFGAGIPPFYTLFYSDDIQSVLYKNAFFHKLWQHLLSEASYSADDLLSEPMSLYGHPLGPMHSAAATDYKIDNAEG